MDVYQGGMVKVWKVIEEIDTLIDPMIEDPSKKEKWKTLIIPGVLLRL